jgi:hypothetical protein
MRVDAGLRRYDHGSAGATAPGGRRENPGDGLLDPGGRRVVAVFELLAHSITAALCAKLVIHES